MSPRISWLLKAAKEKILLKLLICSKRQAGFQSSEDGKDSEGPFKVHGPQNCLTLLTHPDLDPTRPRPGPSSPRRGMPAQQQTCTRTFAATLPRRPSTTVDELGHRLTMEYSTAMNVKTRPQP